MKTLDPSEWKTAALADLLESCPPGSKRIVTDTPIPRPGYAAFWLMHPGLQLHCESCEGVRTWLPIDEYSHCDRGKTTTHVLIYRCANCPQAGAKQVVRFVLLSTFPQAGPLQVIKIGQWPPYGDPTPSRLIELIRPDLQLFLHGRRSEHQGLGIGALAYYRRVVENQKHRVLQAVIDVATKTNEHEHAELIVELRAAQRERQFAKALASVKHAIPNSLMIKGQSPLGLLHDALSDGLHAQDDATCLARAQTIRIVLVRFAERVTSALDDDTQLENAVNQLVKARAERGQKATQDPEMSSSSDEAE